MGWSQVERLVAQGESETLEFKRATGQLNRACETLCGMLNGNGGIVLVGVSDTGRIIGQQVTDHTRQELAAALRRFDPPAQQCISISEVPIPDKIGFHVIVMQAHASITLRPFCWDGRPWLRVQSTTQPMPQQIYTELLRQRDHHLFRWDHQPLHDMTLDQLDRDRIVQVIMRGVEQGRVPEAARLDPLDRQLRRLNLINTDGDLTRAAAVLFGTDFFLLPQCQLRLARFKGTDKQAFVDQKQYTGCAFDLLERAMDFLRQHLPIAGRVQPGLFERADEPLFPLAALREVLANAFCHRDYQHPGGAVSVALFDDRLEIRNPGLLPPPLKPEHLKRAHDSLPRNPLIAETFYRSGIIERWGRGTQLIVEKALAAGHPEPDFLEEAGSFVVRFPIADYHPPYRTAADLNELQRTILQHLANREPQSFQQLHQLAHAMPERSFRAELMLLKQLGLIRLEGHGRGARWWLVREIRQE